MKAYFDIEKLIETGAITDEHDLEKALIADRKLRLLSKESTHFKNLRSKLRDLIVAYESKEWGGDHISDDKIAESDRAEVAAEKERMFIENRKVMIRKRLKELDLTQENLGFILGHKSKTHMSELMNGLKPFTLKDLVVINTLLAIDMKELVPVFLSKAETLKIKSAITTLNKPSLSTRELMFT